MYKMQVWPLYHGQLCGLCGDMDGNEWNEFTTPEFKVYESADPFVRSYKSEKPGKINERVSEIADEKLKLKLEKQEEKEIESENKKEKSNSEERRESSSEEKKSELKSDRSAEKVELDHELIKSAPYEEHESADSESTGEKKVCRVGSKVNRVEEGELLCISIGEVAECSSRETDCAR